MLRFPLRTIVSSALSRNAGCVAKCDDFAAAHHCNYISVRSAYTAYSVYLKEQYSKLRKYPAENFNMIESNKTLAREWSEISEETKQKYQSMANELNKADDEKKSLLNDSINKQIAKGQTATKALNKLRVESGMPSKPGRPFNTYLQKTKRNGLSMREKVAEWKNLSEEERKRYEQENAALHEKYKFEMAAWVDKVKNDGKTFLLRKNEAN